MYSIMVYFRDSTRDTVEYRIPNYNGWNISNGCLQVNIFAKGGSEPIGMEAIPLDLISRVVAVEVEE